jgi:hypothetical protein
LLLLDFRHLPFGEENVTLHTLLSAQAAYGGGAGVSACGGNDGHRFRGFFALDRREGKEGEGRKFRRKEGRHFRRKESRHFRRKEGRQALQKEGRQALQKEGSSEGRKEGKGER